MRAHAMLIENADSLHRHGPEWALREINGWIDARPEMTREEWEAVMLRKADLERRVKKQRHPS